jgi:hypothetical protein
MADKVPGYLRAGHGPRRNIGQILAFAVSNVGGALFAEGSTQTTGAEDFFECCSGCEVEENGSRLFAHVPLGSLKQIPHGWTGRHGYQRHFLLEKTAPHDASPPQQ